MALWIRNRPEELCHESEVRAAELLARLPDTWVIRWGFYYEDNHGVQREGDFLILGPDGGLMVLEAKRNLQHHPSTGRWTTGDKDHPVFQLDAEFDAVEKVLKAALGNRPPLQMVKALCLAGLEIAPQISAYCDIARHLILSAQDLREFEATWINRFQRAQRAQYLNPAARQVFFDTYGKSIQPKAIRHFVDEADKILMRLTETGHELLDQLGENRQFMVQGGTGSGKTWLALEQAFRWAHSGEKVLFLCYNLALADLLGELVSKAVKRNQIPADSVVVRSWEALASELVVASGNTYDVPTHPAKKLQFYTQDLPQLMALVVQDKSWKPHYDALIVDEAQDHNTAAEGFPELWKGPGWWGIYWKLLHKGRTARMAIYYDEAQRPVFREHEGFDPALIRSCLKQRPVMIRLLRTVRYNRPILNYLKSLNTPATDSLVSTLRQVGSLPDGPDVSVVQAKRAEVMRAVERIVRGWVEQGHCLASEILILSKHGNTSKSALAGVKTVATFKLVDFLQRAPACISRTSTNKAKGLDALAVILVDFEPFGPAMAEPDQMSYFMGASRARHLLAVVQTVP